MYFLGDRPWNIISKAVHRRAVASKRTRERIFGPLSMLPKSKEHASHKSIGAVRMPALTLP